MPGAALRCLLLVSAFLPVSMACGQSFDIDDTGDAAGAEIFQRYCAACHGEAQSGRTPSRFSLGQLTSRAILSALESGTMRVEGAKLDQAGRVAVASFLSGTNGATAELPASAYCERRDFSAPGVDAVTWMGFGGNLEGTGFQSAGRAGLTAADVPDLALRWAFAFPGATQSRTKATVVGDVLLVGDQYGSVYAIDGSSGCLHWQFHADSGIRGAILVGEDKQRRSLAWFVDFRTNAYALDFRNGELVWKTRVGRHAESSSTGSPAIHDGRLYVPISSMEVVVAMNPGYECCSGSGALAAVDATTGDVVWYYRVIEQAAVAVGKSAAGTRRFAPSGAPIWSSPTIDSQRGLVYVGTGENFTRPATDNSDAVLAIDTETGELAWSFQGLGNDAWTMACGSPYAQNCPDENGPDLDFGMSPLLLTREDGREILVAGQKSGVVWALDPDDGGAVIWSSRVGKGSALGGVHWGLASDGIRVYAPVADRTDAVIVDLNPDRPPSPGIYALDLMDGRTQWQAAAPRDTCLGKQGCFGAFSAAPTVIPGAVFSGGLDGYIRAYGSEDGTLLWEYDTTGEFETVNGVPGKGGAIDGPGPVVAGGLLLVNSGYGMFGQMPGNVLLAFSAGEQ